MRLDKYISSTGKLSRSECKTELKKGLIKVNGIVVKDPAMQIDENNVDVTYKNQKINYAKYTYILLNKPQGYISATDDPKEKTVLELLPLELRRINLFPCGRLDKDTVGLLLLTNNGEIAHKLLSPKYHVKKTYYFKCNPPVNERALDKLREGVNIGDIITKPAEIDIDDSNYNSGFITIYEGKFHQIKRMFNAVDSEITYLKRVKFSNIELGDLKEGNYRFLSKDEENELLEE